MRTSTSLLDHQTGSAEMCYHFGNPYTRRYRSRILCHREWPLQHSQWCILQACRISIQNLIYYRLYRSKNTMIILNFKKWGQKLCPNLLIKEKSVIQEQSYTLKKTKRPNLINSPNHLPPASAHNRDSLLILSRTTRGGADLLWNTRALRSIQISESRARQESPWPCRFG
jgi:hypothetical protein